MGTDPVVDQDASLGASHLVPGTSKVDHLGYNIAAAGLRLSAQEVEELTDAAG